MFVLNCNLLLLTVCDRFVLMRSLRQIRMTLDLVDDLGKEIKFQSRVENEEAYYCEDCEVRAVVGYKSE